MRWTLAACLAFTALGCSPGIDNGGRAAPAASSAPAARSAEGWAPPVFTDRQRERDEMVRVIRSYGLADEAVLKAMAAVPRHEFVPPAYQASAYEDHPLPIGVGQTISQPYIVAEMTSQLKLKPGDKVLEVGTGSGYQAAVLAHLTKNVYTIEIIKPLADSAAERLKRLGYTVVNTRCGDGFLGWPEAAPFDAVMVTFAVDAIPPPLLEQLKGGGRMVAPVADESGTEWLTLIQKDVAGQVSTKRLIPVRFVPLLRKDPTQK
jgi:protein-L-isoaspartate(D-aspartate) O-methyltransferase